MWKAASLPGDEGLPRAPDRDGTATTTSKIQGLELARFLFALAVLLYHYLWYGPLTDAVPTGSGPSWLIFGRFSVEAFFVVSGYVIARSADGRDAVTFTIARIGRLWPVLAICAPLTFIIAGASLTSLLKALLLAPIALGGGQVDPSYWSIVIEIRFYAFIAFLLFAFGRLPNLNVLSAVWLLASGAALFVPALGPFVLSPYSAFFIFGLLLYSHDRGSKDARWLMPSTLALAQYQIVIDIRRVGDFGDAAFPWWLGLTIASAIFAITFLMRRGVPQWASGAVLALGATTYPLYLLHQLVGYEIIRSTSSAFGPLSTAIAAAAVFAIAFAISQWIEPRARPRLIALLTRLSERLPARAAG